MVTVQLLDIDKLNKDNVGAITDDVICISENVHTVAAHHSTTDSIYS